MDILTIGLITGTSYLIYNVADLAFYKIRSKFSELGKAEVEWDLLATKKGLEGYTLIDKIENKTGYKLTIQIPIGGSTDGIEKIKEHIDKAYRCKCIISDILYSNYVDIELITKEIEQQDYKPYIVPNTTVLMGYDFKGDVILADMLTTPHILISGLSGQGKTGLTRTIICNLQDCDKVLINGFKDDYRGIKIRHINKLEDIKSYIQGLLDDIEEGKSRKIPLYVILEELGKVKDKELTANITKLLQYGRHNNIYVIGIIQIATKEELKFKSYFNTRVSFKQLDSSSYQVALGASVDKDLDKREFYLMSEGLKRGRTYNLEY